ncbi:MAG: PQQ-dependent sugar dehydrogenase [Porticoccaceae bacterium]
MTLQKAFLSFCLPFFFALSADAGEVSLERPFEVEEVVSGLGVLWGMAFVSDDELLITERSGVVRLLDITSGALRDIGGAPQVAARGQGGLLDVAVSPDFGDDGWIYFTYSKPVGSGAATVLARAQLDGGNLVSWADLFISGVQTSRSQHFGSRIAFDDAGHVFFTHGDRGDRHSAQDLSNHGGTVLRLNLDGSVPQDNPFVDRDGAQPEIWSYGHRNPQGIAYDRATGRLWVSEHGPRGGDEINRVEAGKNYGWPVISYGREYALPKRVGEGTHKDGMAQPVKVYVPSIAPGSLLLYSGKAFPQWRGDLFIGALVLTHLNHIDLDDNGNVLAEHRYLEDLHERVRQVIESPQGWLYLSTDSGKIYRMVAR